MSDGPCLLSSVVAVGWTLTSVLRKSGGLACADEIALYNGAGSSATLAFPADLNLGVSVFSSIFMTGLTGSRGGEFPPEDSTFLFCSDSLWLVVVLGSAHQSAALLYYKNQ